MPQAAGAQSPPLEQLVRGNGCKLVGSCGPGEPAASSLALSPDGRNLYTAAAGRNPGASVIGEYARERRTGALRLLGCVHVTGSGGCASKFGPNHSAVIVTPDGRFVYSATSMSPSYGQITVFARNPESGRLRFLGCVAEGAGPASCSKVIALGGVDALAIDPHGRFLYGMSNWYGAGDAEPRDGESLTVFRRDPASGSLAEDQCITNGGSDGLCSDGVGLDLPNTVMSEGDGSHVYVGSYQGEVWLSDFALDPSAGTLSEVGCVGAGRDALALGSSAPCVHAPGGGRGFAEVPDGSQIFAASEFGIVPVTTTPFGQGAGGINCLSARRRKCGPNRFLDEASQARISGDGRTLYVSSFPDYANGVNDRLDWFARNATTHALRRVGCLTSTITGAAQSGCSVGAVAAPGGMATTSDGRNLYIASTNTPSAGIVAFGPALVIQTAAARETALGVVRVAVHCPRGHRLCRGELRLRSLPVIKPGLPPTRSVQYGNARFRVPAGTARVIKVALTPYARALLSHHSKIAALAVATDSTAYTGPTITRLTLAAAR